MESINKFPALNIRKACAKEMFELRKKPRGFMTTETVQLNCSLQLAF